VGDFNNDARLDIVVVNANSNNVGLLLANDDGSFGAQVTYSTGVGPYSVAAGDFNDDSRLDIIVANYYSYNISVLLQYNRGALAKNMTYASGGGSSLRYIALADLNNDSHPDLVAANYGTNDVSVLFDLGNATFRSQTTPMPSSNSHPSSVAIADYNGDQQLDIAVINYVSTNVDLMIGNGNDTCITQINNGYHFVSSPFLLTAGDFDNDGRSEIVVGFDDNDNIDVLFSYNIGSFTIARSYSTGSNPASGGGS
ncbi:unnamed protein product, partial [Adineta ricciae]